MNKPILFLIFNRPDTTQKVFEQIRLAKPQRLYLASDGSRASKEGEAETVATVRKWVLDNIDWPCEVKTLFREENLGCGKAVSGAITWFFSQEESGIILEDDCLPNQSFFKYCEELLDRYKDDKRIWHIAGDNPLGEWDCNSSYYFSKIQHCWGWASWADRWQEYDFDLKNYSPENIKNFSDDKYVQRYWANILTKMQNHEIDTWDYQWTLKTVENKGLCINPTRNLVSNIGFEGTHYSNSQSYSRLNTKTYEIENIIHPENIDFNQDAVNQIYEKVFGIKKPSLKEFMLYAKKYPLFMFRKDFWNNFI